MEVAVDRTARRVKAALITVVVLLVATLGAGAFLGVELARASDTDRERGAALRVARQFTVNFTTIDHETVDKDISRVQRLASGDFAQEYENAAQSVQQVVEDNETVSSGEVLAAGLVDFDGDDARALVVADSDLKNVALDQTEQRHYRLQLDLALEDDGWRVVDVMFVQ